METTKWERRERKRKSEERNQTMHGYRETWHDLTTVKKSASMMGRKMRRTARRLKHTTNLTLDE